jgi:hypothetical protein
MPHRKPKWSRDELILVLDLYLRVGHRGPGDAEVIELSTVLKGPIHTVRPDLEKFRDPAGVALKLANFQALDPPDPGAGMTNGGRGDVAVWDDLHENPAAVARLAAGIRAQLGHSDEVAALARELDASPVWAMSLGSKELFHSNLLAWFMDHQPEVREAIVQAWTKPEPEPEPEPEATTAQAPKVLTEYKHLDLVVYTPGRQVLVIENKVFALPDEKQLAAYSANTIPKMHGKPARVLLSLTDPGWPKGCWTAPTGQRWWWRSYDDLRALLAPLVPAVSRDDPYAGETLSRWLDLLKSLQHRLTPLGLPADGEPLPLHATYRELLATARLNTPVQKMRFAHLVRQVRMQLPEQTPPLSLLAGLTNTVGLAEGFARGRDPEFGWQMQGNKFRLAVDFRSGPGHGTGKDTVAAGSERARQYLDFFNFKRVRRLTGEAEREMPIGSDSFDHYSPGFYYRYMPVSSITLEDAVSLAVHYSKHVAEYARQHSV